MQGVRVLVQGQQRREVAPRATTWQNRAIALIPTTCDVLVAWLRPTPPFFIGGDGISQRLLAEDLVGAGLRVTYVGTYSDPARDTPQRYLEYTSYLNDTGQPYASSGFRSPLVYERQGLSCAMVHEGEFWHTLRSILRGRPRYLLTAQEHSDRIAELGKEYGAQVVAWLHSGTDIGMLALRGLPHRALATSAFVQQLAVARYGVTADLFYPPFRPVLERFRPGEDVGMFNPIPSKGVATFLALARELRARSFVAVEGWYPVSLPTHDLERNVRYVPRVMNPDEAFSRMRVLLVPSVAPEGFGRVVVEAGLRGLPYIVSSSGALPEAAGDHASSIDPHDSREWRLALQALDDRGNYVSAASQARLHAQRFVRDTVAELRAAKVLRD